MKKWFYSLLLLVAGIPVIWALFKPGFYITHDGEFNLIRSMHFYSELTNGQFPVRWTYGLLFGFGSPIFTFFYPLTYYLTSIIHSFGFDFSSSLKILIGGSSLGSVVLMYFWLRRRYSDLAAFFGALVYLYVPYRLILMYVTGTFGALLSLFCLPLIFIAIDEINQGKRKAIAILAIGLFGLLTAHNVTALILLPIVVCYAGFALWTSKRRREFFRQVGVGLLLGIALAAFFLIPALTETGLVYLSRGIVVNFRDHFPTLKQLIYSKWGYFYSVPGPDDGMSFQLGLAQWAIFGLALVTMIGQIISRKLSKESDWLVLLFLILFGVSIFMMLPSSLFIWDKLPILAQIQFPWRILAASIVLIPVMAAYLASKKFGLIVVILMTGILFFANRNNMRTWETIRYPDASYLTRKTLYNGSTDIAWETRPIWVDLKPTWLASNLVEENPLIKILSQSQKANGDIEVTTDSSKSAVLVLNRFYYPVWRVSVDGQSVEYTATDPKGLLDLEVPAGNHNIKVSYHKTKIEGIADWISLAGLAGLVYLLITSRRPKK